MSQHRTCHASAAQFLKAHSIVILRDRLGSPDSLDCPHIKLDRSLVGMAELGYRHIGDRAGLPLTRSSRSWTCTSTVIWPPGSLPFLVSTLRKGGSPSLDSYYTPYYVLKATPTRMRRRYQGKLGTLPFRSGHPGYGFLSSCIIYAIMIQAIVDTVCAIVLQRDCRARPVDWTPSRPLKWIFLVAFHSCR